MGKQAKAARSRAHHAAKAADGTRTVSELCRHAADLFDVLNSAPGDAPLAHKAADAIADAIRVADEADTRLTFCERDIAAWYAEMRASRVEADEDVASLTADLEARVRDLARAVETRCNALAPSAAHLAGSLRAEMAIRVQAWRRETAVNCGYVRTRRSTDVLALQALVRERPRLEAEVKAAADALWQLTHVASGAVREVERLAFEARMRAGAAGTAKAKADAEAKKAKADAVAGVLGRADGSARWERDVNDEWRREQQDRAAQATEMLAALCAELEA